MKITSYNCNIKHKIPEFDEKFYLEMYPDVRSTGADPLLHYLTHGWREGRTPSRYITTLDLIATNKNALKALQAAGRRPSIFSKMLRSIFSRLRVHSSRGGVVAGPNGQPLSSSGTDHGDDVLYVGYIEAMLGLGEASRGLIAAAIDGGAAIRLLPYNYGVENRFHAPFMPDRYDLSGAYPINIIDVSIDELPEAIRRLGKTRVCNSYNILRTYWELSSAPEEWRPIVAFVDEIWVGSEFIRQALSTVFNGPIIVIPPIVVINTSSRFGRGHFALSKDVFYFMFSFDFHSSIERKNPMAVIQAFHAAFDLNDRAVGLVIKCHGVDKCFDAQKAMLAATIADDDRILLIDSVLTRDEFISLLAASDCYVSLHRAEGFGLGMAEAMLLQKPVIGTNFSGNVAFLSEDTGFPVDFKLNTIYADEYPHAANQVWAEPKLDDASRAFRAAFDYQAEGRRRALKGKRFIEDHYNSQVIGALIKTRLDKIASIINRAHKWHSSKNVDL